MATDSRSRRREAATDGETTDPRLHADQAVDEKGHLRIGSLCAVELARTYGTPLYVYSESAIRDQCRAYVTAFRRWPGGGMVAYAAKAALTQAIAAIAASEGLWLDVVSAGEFRLAVAAGAPAGNMLLHGNNKARSEVDLAIAGGIGRVVVDNLDDLALVSLSARDHGVRQAVQLRVAPGIEAHTHAYIQTGSQDSKFGLDLQSGQAMEAVRRCAADPCLELLGLHAHIGSQLLDGAAYAALIDRMVAFAAAARDAAPSLAELNLGGGAGVRYRDEEPPSPQALAETITERLSAACAAWGLPLPRLVVEPGRSIVAEAGTALYTVGTQKRVPGLPPFIAVDGGMGDNIRPALYGAEYAVVLANRMRAEAAESVSIVGRYCESGDFLAKGVRVPALRAGDVLAFLSAGAYQLPMASNYNLVGRPCVLLVREGQVDVIVRRETFEDLAARDVLPERLRATASEAAGEPR